MDGRSGMKVILPVWRPDFPNRQGPVLVVRARHARPLATADLQSLSPAEHVRCAAFRQEADRQRCRWARVLSRRVLGRYLGSDPSTLHLVADPRGKPAVAGGGPDFSLSHGGAWVVAAFAWSAVGVDVEPCVEAATAGELGPRVLSTAERVWAAADPAWRFTALWTRKEALLKRSGAGLVDDLPTLEVLADRADLCSFDLGDGHLGAVAGAGAGQADFIEAEALGL